MINQCDGYVTSRDYGSLIEFMKLNSVICLVDWWKGEQEDEFLDVCHTLFGDDKSMQVTARGIYYIHAQHGENKTFINECESWQLRFLVPTIE